MSKRLHRRGRYPKGYVADQISNTNPPAVPSDPASYPPPPEVPFYSAPPQPQAGQINWTHPSYSNPTSYQQNQIVSQQPMSGSYWSGGQQYSSVQPLEENDPWKWNTENNAEIPNNYNNYQPQWPQQPDQWQMHQVDNETYTQQQPLSYNSTNLEFPQPYVSSAEYQTTNNNSNVIATEAVLPSWENGGHSITQPETMPWTYSSSQYNPSEVKWPADGNIPQNTPNHVPTNVWTGNTDYPTTSSDPQDSMSSNNYLPNEIKNLNVGQHPSDLAGQQPGQYEVQKNELDCVDNVSNDTMANIGNASNLKEPVADAEYGAGALSAFFQNADQAPSENNSTSSILRTPHDASCIPDLKVLVSSSLDESVVDQATVSEGSFVADVLPENDVNKDQERNFIQEENSVALMTEQKLESTSISPIGFVEEPINQEVPEPSINNSTSSKATTASFQPFAKQHDASQVSLEEPLNQQVPVESEQISCSSSSERERIVIQPREESPFKPPRQTSSTKGPIVQQETLESHAEAKQPEEKTVVQEVNLETLPDNLERPPDYEELRKQSPLYSSHQRHLRNEMNSSPSSLLCDNLDIPCVTLAPAAPPLHSSAKSDKSESSNDSKLDSMSFVRNSTTCGSNFLPSEDSINQLSSKSMLSEVQLTDASRGLSPQSSLNSTDQIIEDTKHMLVGSSTASQQNKPDINKLPTTGDEIHHFEASTHQSHLPLRDSKINGKYFPDERNSVPLKKLNSDHYPESGRRETSYPPNPNRIDPRYMEHNPESPRQRFSDQRYASLDERSYYSDREHSRPSSRTSLGERVDDRSYRANNDPRRHYPPDYDRPPSRMSETDAVGPDKHGSYSGYYPQQYPYNNYPRQNEYPQRPANYRGGYEYDPYRRDPYYAYYDAYRYAYSNYNYGFYDELYRNDPRYRQYREAQEQYRQYYAKYGYDTDYERSSVHSGRSSANELSKEVPPSQYRDIDSNESEYSAYNQQYYPYGDVPDEQPSVETSDKVSTPSARLTPVKFSYAHPIARFSPGGLLITSIPSQSGTVVAAPIKIHNLQVIMENEESFIELKNYQGPLIRGSTHKNDVVEFCTQKVNHFKQKKDVVDRESYILLWELMVLLLRQNGSVAGSDIAELLLKDHDILRPSPTPVRHAIDTPQGEHSPADINDSSSQSHAGDTSSPDEGIVVLNDKNNLNISQAVDIDKITRKFREFLLFGHKKDALEWAMKHCLWGHALFLASKMDIRTYANVMTRFANSLALNDPLQTLYQLMSGRQPSSVTSVADKKWGDWRPHLAMILSNPSSHPDVDKRSITTLGDTLASRGCLPAAHFCYIMAQVEFGTYEQKNSKFVLLSTDHLMSFEEFATNEAIQCTEIYEYAQSLANPGYMLVHLQAYKFLYAMQLVEHGFLEEALHYCEVIAGNFQSHPHLFPIDLISEVHKLATQLKYHDPHFLRGDGEWEDQDDPEWLKNLSFIVVNYDSLQAESIKPSNQHQETANISTNIENYNAPNDSTYQNLPKAAVQTENYGSFTNQVNYHQTPNWGQQNSMEQSATMPSNNTSVPQDNISYYQGDVTSNQSFRRESTAPSHEENETTDVPSSPVTQTPPFDYYGSSMQQVHDSKQSIHETVNSFNNNTSPRERRDSALSSGSRYSASSMSASTKNLVKEKQKSETKKEKPNSQVGKTWLGGIFSRLLPKAPNQMILPDDKNPTIFWDPVKNCWVNKDSNDDDEINAPLAPPTDVELMGTRHQAEIPPVNMQPVLTTSPTNKFQRPKTRAMRQNYVDIFNPGGNTLKSNVSTEALFPSPLAQTSAPKMFVPSSAPMPAENSAELVTATQSSFGTPASLVESEEQHQSKNSTPLMLDPAEFDSRTSNLGSQRHTLGRVGRRTYPT